MKDKSLHTEKAYQERDKLKNKNKNKKTSQIYSKETAQNQIKKLLKAIRRDGPHIIE